MSASLMSTEPPPAPELSIYYSVLSSDVGYNISPFKLCIIIMIIYKMSLLQ